MRIFDKKSIKIIIQPLWQKVLIFARSANFLPKTII